jgi:predicted nucleic acid-binding protein
VIVLVDTDILIDVALDRAPFAEPACALLDQLELAPGTAFLAWHSISNFYYLVSARRGRRPAKDFLLDLTRFIEVAATTTEDFRAATRLRMADFEDALQVSAALACGAEVIATRNLADYNHSPVPAVEPEMITLRLRGQ